MAIYTGIKAARLESMSIAQTTSLGEFIRTRRERLSPEQVGLTRGSRRRAKGLRREELADSLALVRLGLPGLSRGVRNRCPQEQSRGLPRPCTCRKPSAAICLNSPERAIPKNRTLPVSLMWVKS